MSGVAEPIPECEVKTMMITDHITFQVRSSGYGRVGLGRSFGEDPNTGRHENAPVRCPCSCLAALYGAPLMQALLWPSLVK